jgi:hypothetical protein
MKKLSGHAQTCAVANRNYIDTGEVFAGERIQRFVRSDSARGKLLEQLSALP